MNYIFLFFLYGLNLFYKSFAEEENQQTISIPKSHVSCNFNNDNCDWYTNNYIDENGISTRYWTRRNYGTPSSSTGPNNGHYCSIDNPTYGRFCVKSDTTSNYYVYTEASGYFNKKFDLILRNPIVANTSNCGLIFWTSMYGSRMGSLLLQIKYNNTNIWKTIWSKSGNSGTRNWIQNAIFFDNSTNYFNMRFRGITGSSFTSDIALDDIYFGCDLIMEKPIVSPTNKFHYNSIPIILKSSIVLYLNL